MEKINAWLAGSPSLNLLFLGLAIISFLASVYFYMKGKREKLPVHLTKTFPLVKNNLAEIDGLGIFYSGIPIKTLSLTRVSFWNNGKETINGTDITKADPVRIICNATVQMLGAKISYTRRAANSPQIEQKENEIHISFDFLDQGDGLIIDVYHTSPANLHIAGTIKGSREISAAIDKPDHYTDLFLSPYIRWLKAHIRSEQLTKFVFGASIIFFIPAIIFFSAIDVIARTFRKIPTEYKLSE